MSGESSLMDLGNWIDMGNDNFNQGATSAAGLSQANRRIKLEEMMFPYNRQNVQLQNQLLMMKQLEEKRKNQWRVDVARYLSRGTA